MPKQTATKSSIGCVAKMWSVLSSSFGQVGQGMGRKARLVGTGIAGMEKVLYLRGLRMEMTALEPIQRKNADPTAKGQHRDFVFIFWKNLAVRITEITYPPDIWKVLD